MATEAAPTFLRKARAVLGDALSHFNDDDGWAMSSHVALSALMAVFPFVIFVGTLAAFIGDAGLADRVADLIFNAWPPEVAKPIAAQVHQVLSVHRGGLLTVSILITIYLASNGVEAVRTALNRAYRVSETRSFLFLRAQSILFVLIGAVASLALAFLGVLGPLIIDRIIEALPQLAPFQNSFTFGGLAVTGLLLIVVLVAAHLWLPAKRPPVSKLWPGILVTLTSWLLAAIVFGMYLRRFANYVATYAGLASVVTAIFFLYLVAALMIFGAEFNAALARQREASR
ncbi:MAG: YihY/virulence factor BrkB family protein [Rhizobiales bacterium]|nr:YihY/virulence factor BrkB family protein [Hyphomicrobiales bacterium]